MHSTNYFDTLIEIAEDSPIQKGEMPPIRGEKKSVANLQFDLLYDQPYQFSSDELFFKVFAIRNEVRKANWEDEKANYFSKGQPCFRASPLTKRYGWGVHSNAEGKIALIDSASSDYKKMQKDKAIAKVKAMRSKRK